MKNLIQTEFASNLKNLKTKILNLFKVNFQHSPRSDLLVSISQFNILYPNGSHLTDDEYLVETISLKRLDLLNNLLICEIQKGDFVMVLNTIEDVENFLRLKDFNEFIIFYKN